MSSAVYFKFKASIKQYTIPFDGSAISVKDLRNAIRLSCGLKSTDFELQILDKQGKEFSKEDDLIPKFSDLIVRRMPKANDLPRKKIANPEDMTRRDPYKSINSLPKINPYSTSINLARSNIPDDEKIDIMTKRCSEEYSEKNFLVKSKPYGIPPASYVCNKCHQGGHWIHECPGLRDKDGRLLDFKSVKRPTGIPQDFLLEVSPGTPGAYLTKEGKYMVPIKDAEAYAMGKKEKRPFSIDENPPYVPKNQELPSKIKCSLCSQLIENPTSTPCCSSVYCEKCITDFLYDPEVNGSRKCPNCQTIIEHHTSLVEQELLRQLIQCWKANMLTKEIVDSCVTTLNNSSNKKTELHEDSSKSPDMKFESAANTDANNLPNNKTEMEKVFVNNRRVLKPKTVNQSRTESPSNIQPSTPDKLIGTNMDNKVQSHLSNLNDIKTNDSTTTCTTTVKMEKFINNQFNDVDVNDLIFEKVEDFENCVGSESHLEKADQISDKNNFKTDQNLKIEIVGKRSDNGSKNSIERKNEIGKAHMGGRLENSKTGHLGLTNDLNSMQHILGTIMNHGIDTTSQILNHFPTTTQLVTSVQQQFINNAIPINTMESLQWPIINSMYNNIPLHSMFGATMNQTTNTSNWINNGINIAPSHGLNPRILTKEEFYEKQRKLRAEKMKLKYRDVGSSRSPSGSQSPRRKHKSRSKYRDYKDKYNRKNHFSRNYKMPLNESSKRHDHYDDRSRLRRSTYKSPKEHDSFKTEICNQDIKTIDPKLMEDSINTFLKYLTVNHEDKRESVNDKHKEVTRHQHYTSDFRKTNKKSSSTGNSGCSSLKAKVDDDISASYISRLSRRSSRSRSVPKISKDRLLDHRINSLKLHNDSREPQRDVIISTDKVHNFEIIEQQRDICNYENNLLDRKEKKAKKSKRRDHSDDDDDDAKRKRKHKKHKHKKVKKLKKEIKDN